MARSLFQRAAHAIRDLIARFGDGFDEDECDFLIVEYEIDETQLDRELAKLQALEERLEDALGRARLGYVDGNSVGSGTMEVCCMVKDGQAARALIQTDLGDTEFANYTRIYIEDDE